MGCVGKEEKWNVSAKEAVVCIRFAVGLGIWTRKHCFAVSETPSWGHFLPNIPSGPERRAFVTHGVRNLQRSAWSLAGSSRRLLAARFSGWNRRDALRWSLLQQASPPRAFRR
jgi:hypothetical protein